jgi:Phosphopantetheine attachment site
MGASERTPLEELIVRVWSETLQAPDADEETDFFSIGGDSLTALRAASELSTSLGLGEGDSNRLLVEIFATPTPRGLAEWLVREVGADAHLSTSASAGS